MDSNVDDADDEIVGDEGTASYGEVEDKDSDELEVEEVAAARANRSTGRALSQIDQIAVLEARAVAASSREDGMNAQGRPLRTRTPVNYAEDVQSQRWTQ
jgi:hypothetical protein